ncbi:MAG: hypothetical protein ACE5NW_15240 [Acidiferrobacterales bacterium]
MKHATEDRSDRLYAPRELLAMLAEMPRRIDPATQAFTRRLK